MLRPTNWDKPAVWQNELSEAFSAFGEDAVTIYKDGKLVLPDTAASILERCKFPVLICKAARRTERDGKTRTIQRDGTMTAKTPLYIPKPKPKLMLPPDEPSLVIPEED